MTVLFAANLFAGYSTGSAYGSSISQGQGYEDGSNSTTLFGPIAIKPGTAGSALEVKLPSAQTDFWSHFNILLGTSGTVTNSIFEIGTWGGNKSIGLYLTTGRVSVRWWNGSSWTTIGSETVANYTLHWSAYAAFDVHINLHATTGFVKVYHRGVLIYSYSGNTILNSVSTCDWVRLVAPASASYFQEMIVATHKTIGQRVYTATINAAGGVNTFTSGAYTNVNEEGGTLATTDASYAESGTANQEIAVNTDVLGATQIPVQAVVVNARALTTGGAPTQANLFTRMASTNYHASDKALAASFEGLFDVWTLNPNTTAKWTAADIGNLEIGVRSRT